jgi:hypothetical protein
VTPPTRLPDDRLRPGASGVGVPPVTPRDGLGTGPLTLSPRGRYGLDHCR